MKDRQILLLLAQDGSQGSRYDLFVEDLVRYGISVSPYRVPGPEAEFNEPLRAEWAQLIDR